MGRFTTFFSHYKLKGPWPHCTMMGRFAAHFRYFVHFRNLVILPYIHHVEHDILYHCLRYHITVNINDISIFQECAICHSFLSFVILIALFDVKVIIFTQFLLLNLFLKGSQDTQYCYTIYECGFQTIKILAFCSSLCYNIDRVRIILKIWAICCVIVQ